MTVHILKLCVGADDIDDLRSWQDKRRTRRRGIGAYVPGWTRNMPRRQDEVTGGGSLYWVIRGVIQVRQRILGMERQLDGDGVPFCRFFYDPELVRTEPRPHRAFQGWRYLAPEDAPRDLAALGKGNRGMPAEMAAELRALGLL
jgi:hypothetical protein